MYCVSGAKGSPSGGVFHAAPENTTGRGRQLAPQR